MESKLYDWRLRARWHWIVPVVAESPTVIGTDEEIAKASRRVAQRVERGQRPLGTQPIGNGEDFG